MPRGYQVEVNNKAWIRAESSQNKATTFLIKKWFIIEENSSSPKKRKRAQYQWK